MIDLTVTLGDYVMTALVLNAVDQRLQPDRKPLLPPRYRLLEHAALVTFH